MFIDISQTVKLQFLLSELILARRKSKIETKSALSQDRTVVRNLLLFFIPKISLSKANVTSFLKTQICVLSGQEHPGTRGQNLSFQTPRNLAQALPSAAFHLLLPESPSQTSLTNFNKSAAQKHSFAKSQHWGIRQAK